MKIQEGAISAIILDDDDQILFLRRSRNDDFMPGSWDIPGGGLDYGEEPEEGLKREIMEETGLQIEIIKILTVSTYFMGEAQRIDVTFLCRAIDSHRLKLSSEHDYYEWVWIDRLNSLTLNKYIQQIVDVYIRETYNEL
jgi:8-oxo-dGTP diphosphatase